MSMQFWSRFESLPLPFQPCLAESHWFPQLLLPLSFSELMVGVYRLWIIEKCLRKERCTATADSPFFTNSSTTKAGSGAYRIVCKIVAWPPLCNLGRRFEHRNSGRRPFFFGQKTGLNLSEGLFFWSSPKFGQENGLGFGLENFHSGLHYSQIFWIFCPRFENPTYAIGRDAPCRKCSI